MSIQTPLKDGLYIRPVRPDRRAIRLFIRNYRFIVAGLISLIVASSLVFVDPGLVLVVLAGYWFYFFLRRLYRRSIKWGYTYTQPVSQFARLFVLVAGVTVLLYYVYNQTSYLRTVQDDLLWLLYLPAISASGQRNSRAVLFTILAVVITCLFLVHPVNHMTIIIPGTRPVTLEFILKSEWLFFLSLTSYILIRYMGDAVADLNLIIKVQNRMREMEGSLLRSKVELNENNYLEKVVEIIKDDLFYDHVNIFRLDKYNKDLICIAAGCAEGKELVRSTYGVDITNSESIIGYVAKTQKPYVTNSASSDGHYLPHQAFPDTKAELAVPIRVRNRLYGVLDIQVHQSEYFLDQEIQAIEILANHIGWVIDNSEQFDHISWINRIIETIAAPIFTQSHLDETLQEIADSALEELKADLVFLYSYDDSTKEGISGPIYSGNFLHPELMDPVSALDPDSIIYRLKSDVELIYVNEDLDALNLSTHPLLKPSAYNLATGKQSFIERENIKSNVIIRLLSNGQCVGILFLNFRRPRTFSDWEKKRYSSFMHLAALAIQKMQLQQHVIQKQKTELSNYIHDILIGDSVGLFKILKSIEFSEEYHEENELRNKVDLAIEAAEHLHNDIRWINRLLKEDYSDDLMFELDKLSLLFKRVLNVNTETKWSGDTRLISPTLSRELFIVIREALTNAVRHGNAKNILITGVIKDGELSTIISDDGTGFNPNQVKRMNGLLSMKYRIEEMSGVFKLTSNPGKGTKIALKVPIPSLNEGVS
jgi:signal transduction histidine kinase